jgi:hypothetical protein
MNNQTSGRFRLSFYFGALLVLIPLVSPAAAQTRRENRRPPAKLKANESADISITATVTAREMKFEVVPNPTVEFPGTFARETVWEAERDNFPRPVEPGVIYRNIGVQLVITSLFPEIDKVVSEALGETSSRPTVSPPKRPEPPQPPQPLAPRRQAQPPTGRTQQ